VGQMVGVAAIGDAWLIEPPGGFWPKPGRSAVSGGNRVRVPAGRVITNKQTNNPVRENQVNNAAGINFDQLRDFLTARIGDAQIENRAIHEETNTRINNLITEIDARSDSTSTSSRRRRRIVLPEERRQELNDLDGIHFAGDDMVANHPPILEPYVILDPRLPNATNAQLTTDLHHAPITGRQVALDPAIQIATDAQLARDLHQSGLPNDTRTDLEMRRFLLEKDER
jgi:hypothetical protein